MEQILTKDGKHAVTIIQNGEGCDYLAVAEMQGFDSESMSDWSYWFTIGWYKTPETARKYAAKKLARFNLELRTQA